MWLVGSTFFFSSRRRHTRSLRDWSSDVCSSDLLRLEITMLALSCHSWLTTVHSTGRLWRDTETQLQAYTIRTRQKLMLPCGGCNSRRSEERRVGKECSRRWSAKCCKKARCCVVV